MIANPKKLDRDSLIAQFEKYAAVDAARIEQFSPTNGVMLEDHLPPELFVDLPSESRVSLGNTAQKAAGLQEPRAVVLKKPALRNDTSVDAQKPRLKPAHPLPPVITPEPESTDPLLQLQEWVTRARYGDQEALAFIRKELDANPVLWQTVGDLAAHAESLLIEVIAAGNALVSQSLEREVERLKIDLLNEGKAGTLERLAVQRIVACWLHAQYVDRATLTADAAGAKASTWAKRQDAAEKRFQSAIKSLQLVRRLTPKRTAKRPEPSTLNRRSGKSQQQTPTTHQLEMDSTVSGRSNSSTGSEKTGEVPANRLRKFLCKTPELLT